VIAELSHVVAVVDAVVDGVVGGVVGVRGVGWCLLPLSFRIK
jgi:hypothetical protein